MRIRTKKWAKPELAACHYFVDEPLNQKGNWEGFFPKKQPIHLDLGCGKCTFLAELAYRNKDINYIGVDISYDILGVARRNISERFGEERVDNVALLSYNIEKLTEIIDENEKIDRIYINFCNPWNKQRCHKRRLTHTLQLNTYKKILADDGEIWFKTDDDLLYLSSLRYFKEAGFEIYAETRDLNSLENTGNIQSEHEVMFEAQGIKTKALKARLRRKPLEPGKYNLITYDVDGTLLNSKKIITKKTKAAIENAIAEGKNIALSTGRGQAELRETYEILPDLRYVVSYSGAHVLDRKENKVIYSAAFDKSVAEKIFEVVKDKDIMIQLLTATKSVVQADKLVDISRYGMTVYQESYDRIATPVDDIHEFFMTTEEPIYKINLYHRTHDERVITKEELSGLDIETVFSEKTSVECSVKGVTKGVGVQKLAEYLGITMDEVISVGDADNDYDVLTKSGLAVAMANANDNIRGIADVLVTTNNYDGCAEALRYYC